MTMGAWLFPISRKAGRVFLAGRDEIPVSASSFRALVLDGRINIRTNRLWYVNQGFRTAKPDDDLFVYVGRSDEDLGIIGIGKIRALGGSRTGKVGPLTSSSILRNRDNYLTIQFLRKLLESGSTSRVAQSYL